VREIRMLRCDVEGAGNVAWPRYWDTRRRKSETTGNPNFDLNRRASPRPYKRMPARPVLRPHLDQDDARQPIAVVVRGNGLRSALRVAAHRAQAHAIRAGQLRHPAVGDAEDWCPGPDQCATHQVCDGFHSPLSQRICRRACRIGPRRGALTNQRTDPPYSKTRAGATQGQACARGLARVVVAP
jgi:hypothetical protein